MSGLIGGLLIQHMIIIICMEFPLFFSFKLLINDIAGRKKCGISVTGSKEAGLLVPLALC